MSYASDYFRNRSKGSDRLMEMALAIMGLQQKGELAAQERAESKRTRQAEEMYRQGMLGVERGKLGMSEKESAAAAKERQAAEEFRTGATTRDIQYKMDQAVREEEKRKADTAFNEKKLAIDRLDKMVERGVLKADAPSTIARYSQIDPDYGEILKKEKEEKFTTDLASGLEKYKTMSPKQKAMLKANPTELGGPEVYKEILRQEALKTPTVAAGESPAEGAPVKSEAPLAWLLQKSKETPTAAREVNPALAQGEAGRRAAIAQQPPPSTEFSYQEGYPSAKPDYMYPEDVRAAIRGVEPEESVRNRIESDPRYQSAEVNTLNAIKDWWNSKGAEPTVPVESITGPANTFPAGNYGIPSAPQSDAYVSMPGGPSAMPGAIQQPGFLDNLLEQIRNYSASREEPKRYERYPYPLGEGVPPPVPQGIDLRELTGETRPLGVR